VWRSHATYLAEAAVCGNQADASHNDKENVSWASRKKKYCLSFTPKSSFSQLKTLNIKVTIMSMLACEN
jgi:hypothetical protein